MLYLTSPSLLLNKLPPLLQSREILDVLELSKLYKVRPSELVDIVDDPYGAYCFDEACALFISYLNDKKTPRFPSDRKENSTLKKLECGLL